MKKMIALALTVVLATMMTAGAFAGKATPTDIKPVGVATETTLDEEAAFEAALMGTLLGWSEDGAMMLLGQDGEIYQVNIDPDTRIDDAAFMDIGDFLTVLYDGKLTRSYPAQLTAGYISSYQLSGVVTQVTEDGFMMLTDDEEQVFVFVDEELNLVPVAEGAAVTVYYDGMMTRSIPAQINALFVRWLDMAGYVSSIDVENGEFVLVDEVLGEVIVRISDDTVLYTDVEEGMMVCVATTGMMTMSLPPQVVALEILPMAAAAD